LTPAQTVSYRPWLHRFAVLTAAAAFPLLVIGALVTSLRVGMADPQSIRTPWYALQVWADFEEMIALRGVGYVIEHTHRQLGWIAGVLTIGLAVGLWRADPRRWVRWLGVGALAAISVQGVLGIFRVELDALAGIELAMVHGFVGQLVMALLAVVALVTSRGWLARPVVETGAAGRFPRLAAITTGLLVVQLGLGVWLRQAGAGFEVHVLIALAVAAHAVMLAARAFALGEGPAGLLRRPALLLGVLVLAQVALGLFAWLAGAGEGALDHRPITAARAFLTTAHVSVGAVLLVTSVLLTLRAYHHLAPAPAEAPAPVGATEGMA
jgi:cytochrome c oxidase assembly protein subunit 15